MLKIGAELQIERVHRESERQQQRIAQRRNDAARREKQQKEEESRLKRQHRPEHIRRVEARGGVHKGGEPCAEQKAEDAAQREHAAELCVAVAKSAEINGGKAAGKAVDHPESRLVERVIYCDPLRAHGAHPFAVDENPISIIHKGHAVSSLRTCTGVSFFIVMHRSARGSFGSALPC